MDVASRELLCTEQRPELAGRSAEWSQGGVNKPGTEQRQRSDIHCPNTARRNLEKDARRMTPDGRDVRYVCVYVCTCPCHLLWVTGKRRGVLVPPDLEVTADNSFP